MQRFFCPTVTVSAGANWSAFTKEHGLLDFPVCVCACMCVCVCVCTHAGMCTGMSACVCTCTNCFYQTDANLFTQVFVHLFNYLFMKIPQKHKKQERLMNFHQTKKFQHSKKKKKINRVKRQSTGRKYLSTIHMTES
jgi:hypothetical protein